ncbi:nitronate monooxygenase [Rhodopseudomonas faecalis]|uniref:Nitronate monooxygenase n=1 Tax=Rhodopseudomonas faecalis TaxID=99655 RepID=A0A318THH4_9BRAD|nr:nitronate monooxygenase family protein [Rhodopseudomonas faecalis]PYF03357.1 nitronate monooxygenase [Rhodopseudomonas faecalis]
MWPDRRLIDLFGIETPIIQAPMAGVTDAELMIAAAKGGALASLPCAMLPPDKVREQVAAFRSAVKAPINLNFFSHQAVPSDPEIEANWRVRLSGYAEELGLRADYPAPAASRAPFDEAMCALVEELRPEVVSFHFGLPAEPLLARVKAAGALVLSSATIVREAIWLEQHGVDAVIAQGAEAGGHRGMFLTDDTAAQPGLFALLPQVVDAVKVPVIATGGIADGRGIAAAFALGAAGVQLGTVYMHCPEAKVSALARAAMQQAGDDSTVLTNIMTGRPARGIANRVMRELGPLSADVPPFPHASGALGPLRAAAEQRGKVDFSFLWAGQAVRIGTGQPAEQLTRELAKAAQQRLKQLGAA